MAETTKVLIEPLNGQNYATWKVQCKMALIKDGLWNIVTGTEGEPEGENDGRKYLLRKDCVWNAKHVRSNRYFVDNQKFVLTIRNLC